MQVKTHIHAIKIPFQIPIGPQKSIERFVYAYLIYGKDKIYLIDTGVASSEVLIFDYVRKTGRNPDEISMIVLTHSHPDHIGSAQAIKKATGCTVAAHPGEKSWIEDVELQFRERPVPGFHSLVGGSVEVDRILEEGNVLDLGDGLKLQVFHTPGHSKGSISLWLQEDRVLFTGDAIPLAGDIPIYEDVLAAVRSIKKLKDIHGIKILLASWNDPQEGGRVYQLMDEGLHYFQHIHEIVTKVAGNTSQLTPMELCRRVIEDLGLPQIAVNPLVARSFEANLAVRDQQTLLYN
ncbi:MAG: MBL fold metallo-hydrolase [Deltaproteobacteria bacterium]|nr:MBL fold metallo-hydrolase [Deltaproteobacteria bacterium]MBW2019604.1 MBL fold metallo-hydrolase [Deltaproteobacteria bacterium]MBW2074419.1 MBL fold metallo-hydrolase [Deltaproteobacteria bacterium]